MALDGPQGEGCAGELRRAPPSPPVKLTQGRRAATDVLFEPERPSPGGPHPPAWSEITSHRGGLDPLALEFRLLSERALDPLVRHNPDQSHRDIQELREPCSPESGHDGDRIDESRE